QISVEPGREEPLPVAHHGRRGHGDDRDSGGSLIGSEDRQGGRSVEVREADVHEDHPGQRVRGEPDALGRGLRLDRPQAGEAQDLPREPTISFVVVDDQDEQPAVLAHAATVAGRVKWNVLPRPSSLWTQRRPPWSSTNRLLSVSPSPVPSRVPPGGSTACWNSSKIRSWSSGEIPTPVSATAISTTPSWRLARTSTRPPEGV